MARTLTRYFILTMSVLFFTCRGPDGPVGPPGHDADESLTDPSIQPKVIFTTPAANSVGPYQDFTYQMTVRFNKIMNPLSVKRALRISAPSGSIAIDTTSIRTTGGDVFTFTAYDTSGRGYLIQWDVGLVYTLSVSDSAIDINGNSLSPYTMTFSPEPFFRVRTISPTDGASNVSSDVISIILQFNAPVDSGITSSIHISPSTPGFWFNQYYSDSSRLTFTSVYFLRPDSLYTVTIDTTAHDREGHHLQSEFHSTFLTAPFQVSSTLPSDGATDVLLGTEIEVDTNVPYDPVSVPVAFSITPATPGSFFYQSSSYWFLFRPTNNLQPSTHYTVTVSTELSAWSGKHLNAPYTFSFTTGN